MAAAHSPRCTAAAQERFGLSRSTAAISKETSISVQHLAEKYPTQARAHGGAENLAARRCGSKRLSRRKGKHPKQVAANTTLKSLGSARPQRLKASGLQLSTALASRQGSGLQVLTLFHGNVCPEVTSKAAVRLQFTVSRLGFPSCSLSSAVVRDVPSP